MSISVGADWDMPRRDRAQIDLWRLPLLRHANRGLALDRFADLTRRGDVAFKGSLKRPQCDGIAIGCTGPELQFFPDILGQLLFGNVGVAVRDRLRARPARRVGALPGFPRYEALRVRNAVSHCVFLTVLAQIDHRSILNGVQADPRGLRCIFPSLTIAWYHPSFPCPGLFTILSQIR